MNHWLNYDNIMNLVNVQVVDFGIYSFLNIEKIAIIYILQNQMELNQFLKTKMIVFDKGMKVLQINNIYEWIHHSFKSEIKPNLFMENGRYIIYFNPLIFENID